MDKGEIYDRIGKLRYNLTIRDGLYPFRYNEESKVISRFSYSELSQDNQKLLYDYAVALYVKEDSERTNGINKEIESLEKKLKELI